MMIKEVDSSLEMNLHSSTSPCISNHYAPVSSSINLRDQMGLYRILSEIINKKHIAQCQKHSKFLHLLAMTMISKFIFVFSWN